MLTRIKIKQVSNLTEKEFDQCSKLTFGSSGMMQNQLYHCKNSCEKNELASVVILESIIDKKFLDGR